MEAVLFQDVGRKGRRDNAIVTFRNVANAPKMVCKNRDTGHLLQSNGQSLVSDRWTASVRGNFRMFTLVTVVRGYVRSSGM